VHPDVLVMTATPIPRTLAMTAYGDLDVSVIDELPSGRPEVVTRVIKRSQLAEAYGFIRKQVAKGRQAFIVYPLVDQSEALDLRSASEMHARLSEKEFAGVRVGLMHGQMTAEEKEKVMQAFRAGDVSVLVATTVVEVGIDIPNATVMLIEHAERFGLAQLHQLRGRVGRGTLKSFCILEGDPGTSDSWRRLKVMEETNDGFRIAEEDLAIRGMGNLLGREQSGLPMLKVGDPVADLKTMQWARDDAFSLAAEDPTLADPRYDVLKKRVKALYREAGALARIG
jgi:ATP-dependent DNA helicase RecG